MLESISGKVSLGDSFAAPQKTAAYTKRDTGQNIPQDGCRHSHHTQGNNLNVERKDVEGQTCIGELQKQIMQTPSPIPLEQNGPQRLKGPLESQGGCNKEFLYPVEHMGINEGQTHKEGRPSEITGPLMSVEGCHREEPSSETHSLKVNSDKFVKVYSRQKPTSQSGARMSQPAIQHSSSVSIYCAPKSDIRVQSYYHLNFSRASVVQFRASRYIMCLNRTSECKVMTI